MKNIGPITGLIGVIILLILRPLIGGWFFGPVLYSIIWGLVLPLQAIYIVNEFFIYREVSRKRIILILLIWLIIDIFFSPLSFVSSVVSFLMGWTSWFGWNVFVLKTILVYIAELSVLGTAYYWFVRYFGDE